MSLTENEQKVLEHISTKTYGQAPLWISGQLQMSYKVVKACCESLYALGYINKQGNGRYTAKSEKTG